MTGLGAPMARARRPTIVHEVSLHAALLERVGQSEVAAILRLLEFDLLPDVRRRVDLRLGTGKAPGLRTKQYQDAIADAKAIVDKTIGAAGTDFRERMADMAKDEADYARRMVERFDRSTDANKALPPANVLRAIVSEPIYDRKLRDWFGDLGEDIKVKVEKTVTRGVVLGQTVPEITRSLQLTEGFSQTGRNASTLVRTAVTQVSNRARQETFVAAGYDEYEWVATFDSRTSRTCIALDGQRWKVGKGPMPPAHPNCRSTTVPVLPGAPPLAMRASDTGVVNVATMDEWLQTKSDAYVDALLGKGPAAVWRRGVVPLEDFVRRRTLEPLTYRELLALEERRKSA